MKRSVYSSTFRYTVSLTRRCSSPRVILRHVGVIVGVALFPDLYPLPPSFFYPHPLPPIFQLEADTMSPNAQQSKADGKGKEKAKSPAPPKVANLVYEDPKDPLAYSRMYPGGAILNIKGFEVITKYCDSHTYAGGGSRCPGATCRRNRGGGGGICVLACSSLLRLFDNTCLIYWLE